VNHYPRHVGDFIRATVGLTLAERGAYDALLDHYYANEGPLPLDKRGRYRMANAITKAERDAVDYVVFRFFTEGPDGWHNARADREIAAYQGRAETARKNGANGGRPPNRKETESVISGNPEETGSKTNQEPVTSNQNQKQGQKQKRSARGRAPPAGKPASRSPRTPIPDTFAVSDRVAAWAAENGHDRLPERLASFRLKCQAKGYEYADWDAAFMEAIRANWAMLGDQRQATAPTAAVSALSVVGKQTTQSLKRWIDTEGVRDGTTGP